jgi:D-cysteine desulfhydrase
MNKFQLVQKVVRHEFPEADVRVFRDDLFPFLGGGNKARKIQEIAKEIKRKNANAIVTTGGIQSNHCRAAAIIAAENDWLCHLVLHGNEERYYSEKGNAFLMRKAGAVPTFVEAEGISDAMDEEMKKLKSSDYTPFYIWGGGHSVAGARAYVHAVQNLKSYFREEEWLPDAIFLASGTGSTQAGIMAGLELSELGDIPVLGISIARDEERGKDKIESLLHEMSEEMSCEEAVSKIRFYDDWVSGGYENITPEISKLTDDVFSSTGILLDTTYTAKAWLGMRDMLKDGSVSGNILFWHTGGILNLMA